MKEKPLTYHEIVFLYKEILFFHENLNGKKFDIRHGAFQAYTKNNKIDIEPIDKGHVVRAEESLYKDKSTYFSFKNSKSSQVASLLAHLRNAVAHCNITQEKIHGHWFYCFKDYYQKKLTMTGKLKKKQLKEFVAMLKTTEK